MISDIVNKKSPNYLNGLITTNDRNMRSQYKLIIKKPNEERMSFTIGAPKIWNEIPDEIKEIALHLN